MTELMIYAIKSAIALTLLYIPYTLMLRREKQFRFNRIVLLGILVASLVLPLLNVSSLSMDDNPVVHVAQQQVIEMGVPVKQAKVESVPVTDYVYEDSPSLFVISWFTVLSLIYIIGMAVVLMMRLWQLARMGKVIRGGALWKDARDGFTIYCHQDNVAPFSWMHNVVISQQDYESNGREIIIHELGHIRNHHSFDILLLTAVEMLQWWNPVVYLLGISLRDIHEYEADAHVLQTGVSLRDYTTLIIRKAVGASPYVFSNNFNHSLTKKRIYMMNKMQSKPWMRYKVLYAIPIAFFTLSVFATPKFVEASKQVIDKVQKTSVTGKTILPAPQPKDVEYASDGSPYVDDIPIIHKGTDDVVPIYINRTEKETLVSVTGQITEDDQWFWFGGDQTYIEDVATGDHYKARRCLTPLCWNYFHVRGKKNKMFCLTMVFPPIPKTVKEIRFWHLCSWQNLTGIPLLMEDLETADWIKAE